MDSNDINDVSEKVDQAIKSAEKRLTLSGSLIIQQKRKIDTFFHEDIPRKKYKSLDQRKSKHYSGRVGKEAEMMWQFYTKPRYLSKKKLTKKWFKKKLHHLT